VYICLKNKHPIFIMQAIIDYFSTIPSAHRSLILAGGIAFFWLIETIVPLFRFNYSKWKHAGINIFFTLTTIIVNFCLAFALLRASDWVVSHQFGVFQWLSPTLPVVVNTLLGLMLLDLIGAWFIHFLEHRVKWMWQFHLIHHTDTHLDATSANRHHPGESIFRFVFTSLAVLVVGAPIWLFFLYQTLSAALSQFNHANIHAPQWLNKALGWLIVMPQMHHVHHHYQLPYSDVNYGNIFALWDRAFGTYQSLDADKIVYGLDTHPDPAEHSSIIGLLKAPFQKYRKPTT
jgi:sterol desaturase/sphingolipid hydroxylase (fatty acid hydroxylase superfamily)